MQLSYYHKVLSEGTDVRPEGLIWIIKAIWFLGFNINLAQLPKFLDEQAIDYLFKVYLKSLYKHSTQDSIWKQKNYKTK